MKNNRKNEHKKLIKLVSEQETLIKMLTDYYVRTDYITRDVQDEMFPETDPVPCDCCDELVYPILQFIYLTIKNGILLPFKSNLSIKM
jgi:hypothetical protein